MKRSIFSILLIFMGLSCVIAQRADSIDIKNVHLKEVVVNSRKELNDKSTLNSESVGKLFFLNNNTSNFAKTLTKLSGVSSMDIGAGASKPVIRGLAFNRIAVIDKGVTQQDQQWGADHALEIDQYDVEDVVVYKGPMSLQFGSDAMGGAIEIVQPQKPDENIYYGDATFITKSNNNLWGVSLMNALKVKKWFAKVRYTTQQYGDYRVPADRFEYMTYDYPIYNRRLKNTAGKENNVSGVIQFIDDKIETGLTVSNVYRKTGFFPGAHGIPDISRLTHDGSYRNIEYPRNNVDHFKVISNTKISLSRLLKVQIDVGFQDNHRQEWSYFHTHYDNQLPPENNPDLELDFNLKTYSFNGKVLINENSALNHIIGIQSSLQHNRIKGYSFFLPRFNQFSGGLYTISNYKLDKQNLLTGGIRYDYSKINITGFYDEILAEYLTNSGYTQEEVKENAQRAYDLDKKFDGLSGSLGFVHICDENSVWKANMGVSFRFPTANELGANGMHHGAFRHEQGNPTLDVERGYQFDFGYTYQKGFFSVSLSPFASYFSNYIFLEPQGEWSILPHAGQKYQYKESEAFFAGGEYTVKLQVITGLELITGGEYVYNRNITEKRPLPFTPPFSMRNEISYSGRYKILQSYNIAFEHQLFAAQNRISNNEEKTPGTSLFNLSVNTNLKIDKMRLSAGIQVQNIFDTKYLNHLSFYRKLNIPEPGRNIQLLIKVPFYI